MLNVKYWRIFCDVIYLLALVIIVSVDSAHKEVSTKKILKIVYGSVFVIWLYLQKAMYRPCDIDLWHMKDNFFQWIDSDPISVLYEFQIDIYTNELRNKIPKYARIGLLHVKRRTQWRPIVTKFGTLIENIESGRGCMTAYFLDFYWQFYEN